MRDAVAPLEEDAQFEELDYNLCSLPECRVAFRGPMPSFDEPFIAVLGGNETFGRYVACPFSDLVADWTGVPVANLGVGQAGLSLFSEEPALLDVASRADVTVLQVLGAPNMSNRLYSVHSRRNDRFLTVSPALRDLFPKVEFTDIHFTGHLLATLRETSEAAFSVVVEELRWAWVQRMRRILSLIKGDVILLWLSDVPLAETRQSPDDGEPRFVDQSLIEQLDGSFARMVEVVLEPNGSLDGMQFPGGEADVARRLPGPAAHHRIAEALSPVIAELGVAPGGDHDTAQGQIIRVSRSGQAPQ